MSYTIYYDAYQEAEWFRGLSPNLSGAQLKPINESIEPSFELNRAKLKLRKFI